MSKSLIKVAIIGGGLAGAVLMNALLKHTHLDVHIYEASSSFKERGASVGLSRNASKALELLGLRHLLSEAGGVQVLGSRRVMGQGPEAGELVNDQPNDLTTIHRAAFLEKLLALIPQDRMHTNKELISINGTTVTFADKTSLSFDVVIGADGIHSKVRRFVLGEEHPAVEPVFAGFWDCRGVVPLTDAVAGIGTRRIDLNEPRQHMYLGDGVILFHDIIDDGKNVCIIASGRASPDWDKTQWKQMLTREWLNMKYSAWGDFGKTMLNLLCGDENEISAYVQWESALAPTYCNKSVCIMGDAAHATTPWQGAGLGQAIEDCLILDHVLGQCLQIDRIPDALQAYDEERRPRSQQVIKSSHGIGLIYTGAAGKTAAELKKMITSRWDFIHDFDLPAAADRAVNRFKTLSKAVPGS